VAFAAIAYNKLWHASHEISCDAVITALLLLLLLLLLRQLLPQHLVLFSNF
jgi:hypothetical protein